MARDDERGACLENAERSTELEIVEWNTEGRKGRGGGGVPAHRPASLLGEHEEVPRRLERCRDRREWEYEWGDCTCEAWDGDAVDDAARSLALAEWP